MPALGPSACLCCALLSLAAPLEVRVAYVTHAGLRHFSCALEPPPCSLSALSACRREDRQPSPPAVRLARLTVWYTSAPGAARLLHNALVRRLTLIRCGAAGPRGTAPPQRYFAVQHLERLTVVHLRGNAGPEEARDTGAEAENGADLSTFVYNRVTDTDRDLNTETESVFLDLLPPQDLFPPFHEQVRLGVIDSAVLDSGAEVKAYTVRTHIGSDGRLPFPELHLPRLDEASAIYVSFVY